MKPEQCNRLHLPSPILSIKEFDALRRLDQLFADWKVGMVDITLSKAEGVSSYIPTLDNICEHVSMLIDQKYKVCILTDRSAGNDRVPISAFIALGAVHQHLIMKKQRSKIALIVETGEAREVHHFCCLLGYGADAICPYLAIESFMKLARELPQEYPSGADILISNYKKASMNGILKVMSKMGISTLQSYKGAQIFEALGVSLSVVQRCFTGTPSRIKGYITK
jgi:glutamate synthase (NADH)